MPTDPFCAPTGLSTMAALYGAHDWRGGRASPRKESNGTPGIRKQRAGPLVKSVHQPSHELRLD